MRNLYDRKFADVGSWVDDRFISFVESERFAQMFGGLDSFTFTIPVNETMVEVLREALEYDRGCEDHGAARFVIMPPCRCMEWVSVARIFGTEIDNSACAGCHACKSMFMGDATSRNPGWQVIPWDVHIEPTGVWVSNGRVSQELYRFDFRARAYRYYDWCETARIKVFSDIMYPVLLTHNPVAALMIRRKFENFDANQCGLYTVEAPDE
jgi:NAD-dependent dihydropyrimidine dehydrogenase PreA subunit